ncbi:MAG: hypothetical protein OHK0040_04640 [bacterium]
MRPETKKRLLVALLTVFLVFNLAFLFRIELVNKLADISVIKVIFLPSRTILYLFDYTTEKARKLMMLSNAYDMLMKERREKAVIEAENLLLKEKLSSLERVVGLEELKKRYPFKIEVSKVIGRNPLFWHQHILIEGGKDRGFEAGMPVMSKDGLIGKITVVYNDYSKVLLLIDPEFSVDVRGMDSNVLALCSGVGTSVMKINYVPRFEELKVGEMMVSSGLDMAFPPGIPVGYLIEVNKPFGSYFIEAYVIPAVDVLKIREVMVVKDYGKLK